MLPGLSESEYTDLVMSVGTHKRERRLPPIRVAELLEKSAAKSDLQKIANELQLSETTIPKRFLSLLDLPAEAQGLVSWGSTKGTLSFSVAAEVARLKDPQARSQLVKACLENRLTRLEVSAVLERMKRGNVNLDVALAEFMKLRPLIERQYLFVGSIPHLISTEEYESWRGRLRKSLAKRYGAENVLSVSAKDGRYSILLTENALGKDSAPQSVGSELEIIVKNI